MWQRFGENGKSYEEAASNFNSNPSISLTVTWKSKRERYKRLQKQFYKSYTANQLLSGVRGEILIERGGRGRKTGE